MRIYFSVFRKRRHDVNNNRQSSWRGQSIVLMVALAFTGGCVADAIRSTCRPYEAIKERAVTKWQAQRSAHDVWQDNYAASYAANQCADEVRDGFVAAYVDTAMGMGSCPPPVPTRPVLSRYTLTHTYPAASPWYEGYNLGHIVAVSNGVDRWRLAPLNPDLVAACGHCAIAPVDDFKKFEDEILITPPEVELLDQGLIEEGLLPEELPPVMIESFTS